MTRAWRRGGGPDRKIDSDPPHEGQNGPQQARGNEGVSGHQNRDRSRQRGTQGAESTSDILTRMVSSELESSVIASILSDPAIMAELVEEVEPTDFVVEPFASAYRVAVELWEERIPFDLPIASSRLGSDVVVELIEGLEQSAQVGYGVYYAREVAKLGQRRDAITAMGEAISEVVDDADVHIAEVIAKASQRVIRDVRDIGAKHVRQIADDAIQRLRDERSGDVPRRQITSGYHEFDQILGGGFSPGDLVVLAARPSMGKSAFAADVLVNSTDTPGYLNTAIMFSAEMSSDSIMRRFGSRVSGISLRDIRSGRMDDEDFRKVEDAIDAMGNQRLVIDDTRGITTEQMRLTIQRVQSEGPVGLVVFDYMEMAGDGADNEGMNETSRISRIVQSLKNIAMETQVPIMALSQVGRQVDQRKNKVPGMSDLRMSAMIEQTADVVVFMYNNDYYVERGTEQLDPKRSNLMELHIAKNRNGAIGRVDLGYDAKKLMFLDLSDATRNEEWYS